MAFDLANVQKTLAAEGFDGWLLYDFHGSNPIAVNIAGLAGAHTTRRWYYFIPCKGAPRKLVHAIEPRVLDALPGEKHIYAGRLQLEEGVSEILRGSRTIAMEYSPECAIPYLSRVDAGTIDFVRRLGLSVVSSGDLVGRFEAAWNDAQIATHKAASERLYRIKDRTFEYVGTKLSAGEAVHEFEVQQQMVRWFGEEGLIADAAPIVGAQENAGNPHYAPSRESSRPIRPNELLLLDLWGKLDQTGSVYADITWTGFAGEPPAEIVTAFATIVAGRDAAINKVKSAVEAGQPIRGWEVDRVTRDVITDAGFGKEFIHRTGHSLGEEVHGNGVHMDDYETHDDRRLVTGTGFTIEPGIYTPTFGVRTEVNMVVGERTADVTGPCQQALVRIKTRTS